eukprot:130712-Pelagomonas_calceolata.AAC.2
MEYINASHKVLTASAAFCADDESGELRHSSPPLQRVPATPHDPFSSKGSKGGCAQARVRS